MHLHIFSPLNDNVTDMNLVLTLFVLVICVINLRCNEKQNRILLPGLVQKKLIKNIQSKLG